MVRPPVLVVDDNPLVREIARRCLDGEGFSMAEAADLPAALQALERARPVAVLLDAALAGQALPALRSAAGAALPIFALGEPHAAPPPGFDAALEKPLDGEHLSRALHGALAQPSLAGAVEPERPSSAAALHLLAAFSAHLSTQPDPERALSAALALLVDAAGLREGAALLVDDRGELAPCTPETWPELHARFGEDAIFAEALARGVPLALPGATAQGARLAAKLGARSAALVPLAARSGCLGLLIVTSARGELEHPRSIAFWQALGTLVAETLAGHRTLRQLRLRARQQQALVQLGERGLSGAGPEALLDEAARLACEALQAGDCAVAIGERDELFVRASRGDARLQRGAPLAEGPDSLAGFALSGGAAVGSGSLADERRFRCAPELLARGVRSGIAVPLRGELRPAGVLVACSLQPDAFGPDDQSFLEAIANVLAAALARRRVEDALRGQSRVLESVVEDLAAGVAVADSTGIVLWNRAARQLLGPAPGLDWLAGRLPGFTVLRPDGTPVPGAELPLARARAGEGVAGQTLLLRPDEGPDRWLTVSARPLPGAEGVVRGATVVFQEVTQERRMTQALERAQADFRQLIERNPDGVAVVRGRQIVYANQALVAVLGFPDPGAVLGRRLLDLVAAQDRAPLEELLCAAEQLEPHQRAGAREARFLHAGGNPLLVEVAPARLAEFEGGAALLIVARDVTLRRKLEEHLRHSQKMDAIGQLAGGIAHDFNNIIGALLVNVQLVLEQMAEHDPLRVDIEEMRKSGVRAAALTQQLLTFSRQQVMQPRVVDLNATVRDMQRLLGRVLREDIELVTELSSAVGPIRADPGQLEQLILNVCINARDAMPNGGRLVLATSEVELDDRPGRFAALAITDTGVGMDDATRERMFEPFFSTKEKGKGTGLGLAAVYGIVRQSNGRVTVRSAPGEGTTITVALPVLSQEEARAARPEEAPLRLDEPMNAGTVLLVEDDADVRRVLQHALTAHGFRVCEADDAERAVSAASTEKHIDLVVADVVVPGSSGPAIVDCVRVLHPAARALYISGHADERLLEEAGVSAAFLRKPFTPEGLLRKIDSVMGKAP